MCPTNRERKLVLDNNLERLKEAFAVLDRDGDGIIATSDLELFLQESVASKLISKEDVQNMLALVDGDVDFDHFLRLLNFEPMGDVSAITNREENNDEVLRAMFTALDKNRDGFVCEGDLNTLLCSLGRRLLDADVLAMLKGCRSFPDKVTYEEFVALITVWQGQKNGMTSLFHEAFASHFCSEDGVSCCSKG